MADGATIPNRPQDRDLRAIAGRIHYLGSVETDPSDPGEGKAWVRRDLAPPQLRVHVAGSTFKVDLTAV